MSRAGTFLDWIGSTIRSAAGVDVANVERGLRLATALQPEELPHLFLYGVEETLTELAWQQRRLETRATAAIISKTYTQEQLLQRLDACRDAIAADHDADDHQFNVVVERVTIREHPSLTLKAGELVIVATLEL